MDHSEDERREDEDHIEDDGVDHAAGVDLIDGEDDAVDEYDVPVLPNEIVLRILPGGGQSSPFNSRSQARIKEEGWRQEGHPAITKFAPINLP